MLTVDPDERITVQRALEHPWTQEKRMIPPGVGESTESLDGAFNAMGFSKRKVERERTLLSNAVKNSRKKPDDEKPVVVQEVKAPSEESKGNGTTTPAATTAFMKVGGKGVNETLYPAESGASQKSDFPLF